MPAEIAIPEEIVAKLRKEAWAGVVARNPKKKPAWFEARLVRFEKEFSRYLTFLRRALARKQANPKAKVAIFDFYGWLLYTEYLKEKGERNRGPLGSIAGGVLGKALREAERATGKDWFAPLGVVLGIPGFAAIAQGTTEAGREKLGAALSVAAVPIGVALPPAGAALGAAGAVLSGQAAAAKAQALSKLGQATPTPGAAPPAPKACCEDRKPWLVVGALVGFVVLVLLIR